MICDLAETYGVLNYDELPPFKVAALFFGLPEDSRTKRNISGNKITLTQTLLAMIVDDLNFLVWSKTKDAKKGRNKPKSVLNSLIGKEEQREYESFSTTEELDAYFESFEKGGE